MKKAVLIVDDSATLRASVEYTLSEQGYEVLQAEGGEQGLDILRTLAGREDQLGMIITDVNMPGMDGISFIRKVKETPFKFIPILVMTTESQDSKKDEGKQAGASGWLVKPFKPEQLLGVVTKFVQ